MAIAIPVMFQQLVEVSLNLADTIMVGKISEEALAAVGAANQIYFILSVMVFGILSGAGIHAVQFWGIRNLEKFRQIMGIEYMLIISVSVIGTFLAFVFPRTLLGIFTDELEVIEIGVSYLRISCWTYLMANLSFMISYGSRIIMRLKYPIMINAIAISLNIVLNYLLIFGKLGLPEMGPKGAAVATLIARSIEVTAVMIYVYCSKHNPLAAKLHELKFNGFLFKEVIKKAIPVTLNESLWALTVAGIFAIYGRISASALAIVQIDNVASNVFTCVFAGFSNACNVLIGQTLGRGERESAFNIGKKMVKMMWILCILMSVILALCSKPIAIFYNFEPETTTLLIQSLVVYAIAMTPKMFSYMFICGIFRPGGDAVWSMLVDSGVNLIIQVPMAFVVVMVLKMDLVSAIALVAVGDLLKAIVCYWRFYSKKWVNVFTGL